MNWESQEIMKVLKQAMAAGYIKQVTSVIS